MMAQYTPAALSALLKGDMDNFITASTPGGIERQEAEGQKVLVNSELMPINAPWKDLKEMGITQGKIVDDLFMEASLPEGWKKEATDHSMWSNVVDDKGRVRLSIFYKAAFYDRSAHVNLCRRYTISTRDVLRDSDYYTVVDVVDSNKVLHTVGEYKSEDYTEYEILRGKAVNWLRTNYPDYANVKAYWD